MRFGRALSLAVLAAVLPACGDGGRNEPQGRFVLFTENFSDPALSQVWIQLGAGTVQFDSVNGTPPPSLSVGPPLGPTAANIRLTTDARFPALGSLTVALDLLLVSFPTPLGSGTAGFTVFDPDFPSVQAMVIYDVATFSIQFSIGIVEGPKILDPGGFRHIEFSVSSTGTATWKIDGVVQQEATAFPAINLTLSLRNESDSIFDFDSIIITSP